MSAERCKRCDQEQCPASYPSACENDAVDWRTRALAAEAITDDDVLALAAQMSADADSDAQRSEREHEKAKWTVEFELEQARARVASLRAQLEEWRVDNEKQRAAKVALETELKLVQEALGSSDAREAELERDLRAEFKDTEMKLRAALEKAGPALSACHAEIGAWLRHNGLLDMVFEASEAVRKALDIGADGSARITQVDTGALDDSD